MSDIDTNATVESSPDAPAWRLAIDLGTTYTSATIEHQATTELLMIDGEPRISSTVAVDDDGELVAGVGAERVLARAPERAERNPKRRIGDEFFLLGEHQVATVDALTAVFALVGAEAISRFGGFAPRELVVTHPARWGAIRLGRLVAAAVAAGLPEPTLVAEPVAAVWAAAATAAIEPGHTAAIYDLGGGTLDTAVVRRSEEGFDLIGPPGGSDRIGGEMFDERLYVYLGEQLGEADPAAWEHLRFSSERTWRRAAHDFRQQVRAAKEALSVRTDDTIYLGAPVDHEIRLTRDELVTLLEADIAASVDELDATMSRAGLQAHQVDHVFLVGGGSRMPAVAQRVGDWLGSVPTTWGDPKSVVAIGALAAAVVDGRRLAAATPTGAVPITAMAAADPSPPAVSEPGPLADPTGAPFWRRGRLVAAAVAAIAILGGGAVWAAARTGGESSSPGTSTTIALTGAVDDAEADEAALATDSTTTTTTTTVVDSTTIESTSTKPTTTTSSTSSTTTTVPAASGGSDTPVAELGGSGGSGGTDTTSPKPPAPVATTTTTTTTTMPPTTTSPTTTPPTTTEPAPELRDVPNVIGDDFSTGQQRVVSAGLTPVKLPVDCGGGQASSEIIDYSPTAPQPPLTTITLTTCR